MAGKPMDDRPVRLSDSASNAILGVLLCFSQWKDRRAANVGARPAKGKSPPDPPTAAA